MMTLAEINHLDTEDFVSHFGEIAEHSPWVARHAASARPFADREAMIAAFTDSLMAATETSQLSLLRAHPDLAGKAKLTADSASEQAQAGLESLTAEEFAQFTHLNELYKSRFDFPFILAVKGATKAQILESFRERINNRKTDEFLMALQQVARIVRFRLEDRVAA